MDGDVGVAVVAVLLVPETQRVVQLVHDGPLALAACPQGQLLSPALSADF